MKKLLGIVCLICAHHSYAYGWEKIPGNDAHEHISRIRTPQGWLIKSNADNTYGSIDLTKAPNMMYVPDPDHIWRVN